MGDVEGTPLVRRRAAIVRWGQLTLVFVLRQGDADERSTWLTWSGALVDLLRCVSTTDAAHHLPRPHLRTLLRRSLPRALLRLVHAPAAAVVRVAARGRPPLDEASSRRFGALAGSAAHASFLNAYVSTLGGGYYMTRHHVDAVRSATLQLSLAAKRDDVPTFVHCFTHFAYIGASSGCDRVASWAARAAVRMARLDELERDGAAFTASRVALRYVRKVARVRASHELPLSARERVVSGMDDARLADRIRACFRAAGVPIAVPLFA
jgi:hypothetical protein